MSHESELTAIQALDALYATAMETRSDADWIAYEAARVALAERLGLDCPGTPATGTKARAA